MPETAQLDVIYGIIVVFFIAIIAAVFIFPALGTATHQDTSLGGVLMIGFAIVVVIVAIVGFFISR